MKKLNRLLVIALTTLIFASGSSGVLSAVVVVDNSPDTTGVPTFNGTWSNCIGLSCPFYLQQAGDKFTLTNPTPIFGGSIFSDSFFGIVSDPVRFVILPDEGGIPGFEPLHDIWTNVDVIDGALTSSDPFLSRKHASITPILLMPGTYWFYMAGSDVEILQATGYYDDGLVWAGFDPHPGLEAGPVGVGDSFFTLEADDYFVKQIVDGPDADDDDVIDVVVPVKPDSTIEYEFMITYFDTVNPHVLIMDNIPAEWIAVALDGTPIDGAKGSPGIDQCGESWFGSVDWGDADIYKNGKGKNCNSSTALEWLPDTGGATLSVSVETRPSPGKGHAKKEETVFAPTSCGPLYLNDGATAYETDQEGNLVLDLEGYPIMVAGPTNALCLAAVKDKDGTEGLVGNGTGDEDEDGLEDWAEACTVGTDPCDDDSDDDGIIDGNDSCPLEGLPTAEETALGVILGADGCKRQSECSDDLDNDGDGVTDYAGGDASCDTIVDDSEDTFDDADGDTVGDGFDGCPLGGGVSNGSFEAPAEANWGYTATDWAITGPGGAYNAFGIVAETGLYQAGVTGSQVGWSVNGVFVQNTSVSMSEGSTYELIVDIGDRTAGGTNTYDVSLFNITNIIPLISNIGGPTVNGDWVADVTTGEYTAVADDESDTLVIILTDTDGDQISWDNVRLKVNGLFGCDADADAP